MAAPTKVFVAAALAALAAAAGPAAAQILFAGGEFEQAGGASATNVAQWEGPAEGWSNLAALPLAGDSISSLTVYRGEVVAGGRFHGGGGLEANNIAIYDGTHWRPMGSGCENRGSDFAVDVWALTVWDDKLIAAGWFDTAGGQPANNVAAWDGTAWVSLADGVPNECRAATTYAGKLVVGGDFTLVENGTVSNDLALWDGSAWHPLGPGVTSNRSRVWALVEWNGELMVGGSFLEVDGIPVNNTAIWDGAAWRAMGTGVHIVVGPFDPIVKAFAVYRGDLILAGRFQIAGGQEIRNIARWDGSAYHPLGDGLNERVDSLTVYNDWLIAGGNFDRAGNVVAPHVARWDGTAWSSMEFAEEWNVAILVRALTVAPAPPTCSLVGPTWRATYSEAAGFDVQEDVVFGSDLSFSQTLVASSSGDACAANTVTWTGDYHVEDDSTMVVSYIRCTASGPGCLACGATREELTRYKFAYDCLGLTTVAADSETARDYVAVARR